MTDQKPRKFKFIGCEVVYREACHLAATCPNIVDVEFCPKGLHDLETADMSEKIQATIDAVDAAYGYEAILLGYARCNDGVVGLRARDIPLVIPRAHDCITLFFGSRSAFGSYFNAHPGTYFSTSGWMEREIDPDQWCQPAYGKAGVMAKLGLADTHEQLVAKYGKENAEFIRETLGDWHSNYSRLCYIQMNTCNETNMIQAARQQACDNNWEFELREGDWSLLRKLFYCQWDDDFVVVRPGEKLIARNDEMVLDVE